MHWAKKHFKGQKYILLAHHMSSILTSSWLRYLCVIVNRIEIKQHSQSSWYIYITIMIINEIQRKPSSGYIADCGSRMNESPAAIYMLGSSVVASLSRHLLWEHMYSCLIFVTVAPHNWWHGGLSMHNKLILAVSWLLLWSESCDWCSSVFTLNVSAWVFSECCIFD